MNEGFDPRGCDDDFGVNKLLIELAVLALLVGGRYERVALRLDPFAQTKLILSGAEKLRLLLRVLSTLRNFLVNKCRSYVVAPSQMLTS